MNFPPRSSKHVVENHGGPFSASNIVECIDFSSNVLPGGPPPKVASAMRLALSEASTYPDPDSKKMKKCIASYTGVPENTVAVGNGATELIYRFCAHILPKKTKTCVAVPTFAEYESASLLAGHDVRRISCMKMGENLEKFSKNIPKRGCVFVCNPNNPTGELLEKKDMLYLADKAKSKSAFLFVDESFIELVPGKSRSVAMYAPKSDNMIVLRSLTKSFSIPGMRAGYCISNKKITSILNRTCMPWNVSVVAQRASCAAVSSHRGHFKRVHRLIKKESEFLQNGIGEIPGFECVKNTSANFIMVRTRMDSSLIWKKLLKRKILVRDCSSFGNAFSKYIRVAVLTRTENKKLIEALKSA